MEVSIDFCEAGVLAFRPFERAFAFLPSPGLVAQAVELGFGVAGGPAELVFFDEGVFRRFRRLCLRFWEPRGGPALVEESWGTTTLFIGGRRGEGDVLVCKGGVGSSDPTGDGGGGTHPVGVPVRKSLPSARGGKDT